MHGNRLNARSRWTALVFAAVVGSLLWVDHGGAQPQLGNQLPTTRLYTVSPPGVKAGTTVEISWTGTDLEMPEKFLFSHPDIKATPIIPPPPKPDPKAKVDPKAPPPPPPPITRFTVEVPASVPPGNYEVRLVSKYGVSNPRVFVVGDLAEAAEKEPNNNDDQAQRIELGSTVNGAIAAPTDVDYTVFAGKKGQRVLITCLCASIDSRLAPEIRVLDGKLKQIAYNRPLPQHDGAIDVTLPEDGDYYIRVCQFTYTAGSGEFFYRLNITTGPWIDAVHPPMIEPGKNAQVTVYGRNLPGAKPDPTAVVDGRMLDKLVMNVQAPADAADLARLKFNGHVPPTMALLDGFEFRLKGSNPFLMTYAHAPVILENDNNDTADKAQEIAVPAEVAGRMDKKRDRDWYVFSAKKGEVYIIDVLSHRLGAATDMYFSLRNLATKQEITAQDDNANALNGISFLSANRDPAPYRFVVPADGKYHLLVASHLSDNHADPTHFYRLRITPEKPDFRLIVMPTDLNRPESVQLGQGGNENLTVYAERIDGFRGGIALAVEGLPMGVTCTPQRIGPGMKQALVVLSANEGMAAYTGEIKVKGTATVGGKTVIREARSASITWPVQPQQNIPTVTRLDRQLMLAVRDKPPFRVVVLDKATAFHGDKVNVPVKLSFLWNDTKPVPIQIQQLPAELPPGLTFQNVTIAPDKKDATLILNVGANVPPGNYTITLRAFGPIPFGKDPKKKANVNVVLPTTPIALTVLPKQVATLSVGNPNTVVKLGNQAELVVKVARQYDFDGPFKVKLVLPANAQGLSADEITIPAGQNEAKMVVRAAANANVANLQNLSLQAAAVINGNVPLNHEVKININVTK